MLVILGLLVGGVLSGQSLIRAAELRSVVTERDKIVSAVHGFRDKYFELPGDFTRATAVWQAQYSGGNCTNRAGAAVVGLETGACDGNGDGRIEILTSTSGNTGFFEANQFFYHLRKAGFIEGKVNGYNNIDQALASKHNASYWSVMYTPHADLTLFMPLPSTPYFETNALIIGRPWGSSQPPVIPAFTPEDAWNIDTKIDDGKSTTGKAVAAVQWGFQGNDCVAGTDYPLTIKDRSCTLAFLNQF